MALRVRRPPPSAAAAREDAIPSAQLPELRLASRRTTLPRAGLAVCLLGLLAAAVVSARRVESREASLLPGGTSGVVVLDLSRSVGSASYLQIGQVFSRLLAARRPVGLVAFSDTAYELVPPRTPAAALRPFLRLFTPRRANARTPAWALRFPANPWPDTFRGGTRISAGLELARAALEREGVERGSILLVSDLSTPNADLTELTSTLVRFREDAIPLRIVPLSASRNNRYFFERLAGRDVFVDSPELEPGRATRQTKARLGGFAPHWLLAAGGLLILLLACNERWCGRLAWQSTRSTTERPR